MRQIGGSGSWNALEFLTSLTQRIFTKFRQIMRPDGAVWTSAGALLGLISSTADSQCFLPPLFYGTGVAADTGSAVKGAHIDVWIASCTDATAFTRTGSKLSHVPPS